MDGTIIEGDEKRCFICGKLTRYIEVFSERHFCSNECIEKFYTIVNQKECDGCMDEGVE